MTGLSWSKPLGKKGEIHKNVMCACDVRGAVRANGNGRSPTFAHAAYHSTHTLFGNCTRKECGIPHMSQDFFLVREERL